MNKKDVADLLHGREYSLSIEPDLKEELKRSGLYVVYGASDDLIEFDGAICEEAYMQSDDGTTVLIDKDGPIPSRDDMEEAEDDELQAWLDRKKGAKKIIAKWGNNDIGADFTYETDLPHETFDIMEDGEIYCRGMVLSIEDL